MDGTCRCNQFLSGGSADPWKHLSPWHLVGSPSASPPTAKTPVPSAQNSHRHWSLRCNLCSSVTGSGLCIVCLLEGENAPHQILECFTLLSVLRSAESRYVLNFVCPGGVFGSTNDRTSHWWIWMEVFFHVIVILSNIVQHRQLDNATKGLIWSARRLL